MIDTLDMKGHVFVELRDIDGNLKQKLDFPNLVVTIGRNWIASRMASNVTLMGYMALGTSPIAPILANVSLTAEVGRAPLTGTTTAGNVISYAGFFGQGVGTGTLNEAGIFDAASNGNMLCRAIFASPIVKSATDSLTVTWQITVG